MLQPLSSFQAASNAASDALRAQDWQSLKLYAQAMLKEDRLYPVAWSFLGIAYLQLGSEKNSQDMMNQGLDYHRNAVTYGPEDRLALINYAVALARMEDIDSALNIIQRGISLYPEDIELWHRRAIIELDSKLVDEAGKSISHLLKLVPKTPIIPVEYVYTEGDPLPLRSAIGLIVSMLDDGLYICEGSDFDIYGTGSSFKEAFTDFCGEFKILIEEYVDTDDPLDEGAQELAENLRDLIGGKVSAV